jgi:hypothetical protein
MRTGNRVRVSKGRFLSLISFGALLAKKDGNCSLSDGVRRLCQERKLKAFDVSSGHWQDVDTPEAFAYTESVFERDFCENPILQRLLHV